MRTEGKRTMTARERAVQSRRGAGVGWWHPTPKWWILLVTGVVTLLANWLISGEFGPTERGQAGFLLLTLATTWAKSNQGRGG
jgi:hypothetical protein